ncbi:MAG: hypothetical protein C6I05_05875, partial [Epsilonproteobacteria bacterium]|nr:hypothetical protein [Campylobacterota bacterium]
ATFTYRAPKDLENFIGKVFSIRVESEGVSQEVQLIFPKEGKKEVARIVVDPSVIHVQPGESYTITVITLDNENRPLPAKVEIPVLVDGQGRFYGEVSPTTLYTDENGKATFTYTAPKDLESLSGRIYIFQVKSGGVFQEVQLIFPEVRRVKKIVLSSDLLEVREGESGTIDIYTLDGANHYISGRVQVSALIDEESGLQLGYFRDEEGNIIGNSFQTDNQGHRRLIYSAPAGIVSDRGGKEISLDVHFTAEEAQATLHLKILHSQERRLYKVLPSQLPDSVEVDSLGRFLLAVVYEDDEGQLAPKEVIQSITLRSLNHLITFQKGEELFEKEIGRAPSNPVEVKFFTLFHSGVDILQVEVVLLDQKGREERFKQNIPITIVSGPVNTISISLAHTRYDVEHGLFEHLYTILATDKYGNPAKAGSKVSFGAVAGLKKSSNGRFLYVRKGGAIRYTQSQGTIFESTDQLYDFVNVEPLLDRLVILADEDRADNLYLGEWDIVSRIDDYTLKLYKKYEGWPTSGLTYVIGNEKRVDTCSNNTATLLFDHQDQTYTLQEGGITTTRLLYPPYMLGKTIFLYANSREEVRVGATKRSTLFGGTGLTTREEVLQCDNSEGNRTKRCQLRFTIVSKDNPELIVKNVEVSDFVVDDPKVMDKCRIQILDNWTDCSGIVVVSVDAAPETVCPVRWNGGVLFEFAP